MFRRALQRFVRLVPGPTRTMWMALPSVVRDRLAPFVHPIAAGNRRGTIELEVPWSGGRRSVDIVAETRLDEPTERALAVLGRVGHRLIRTSDDADLAELARERRVLHALFLTGGAGPDARADALRRLGWRKASLPSPPLASEFDPQSFVAAAYPEVSIIVISYANKRLCESCLAAIVRNTAWPRLEIIVVDNGSKDGSRQLVRRLAAEDERFVVIENDTNLGFARAANQGIRRARGEFVVLLNDDTAVGPAWLPRLIARLEEDPELGLLSPVTNEIGSDARIPTSYRTLEEMEKLAIDRAFSHAGKVKPTAVLPLFCAVARRSVLEDVGLLDEQYEVGMFEDDDLALTLAAHGFGLGIAFDAFVHHVGSASFGQLPDDEYLRIWEANKRRYEKKWGKEWSPPGSDDRD